MPVQMLCGKNVLTSPTDAHWRMVRKGVSPAFNTARMRDACGTIVQCAAKLAEVMGRDGAREQQNIEDLLVRQAMDVIGEHASTHESA